MRRCGIRNLAWVRMSMCMLFGLLEVGGMKMKMKVRVVR